MNISERNAKLKNLIICMKCGMSGNVCDYNCSTQYEAGNTKEIIENLEEISDILTHCGEYKDIFQAMFNHIKRVKDHYMTKHLNHEELSHDEIITFGNYITLYNACINAMIGKEIKELYPGEEGDKYDNNVKTN